MSVQGTKPFSRHPYRKFISENYKEIKKSNPLLSQQQIHKLILSSWRGLDETKKQQLQGQDSSVNPNSKSKSKSKDKSSTKAVSISALREKDFQFIEYNSDGSHNSQDACFDIGIKSPEKKANKKVTKKNKQKVNRNKKVALKEKKEQMRQSIWQQQSSHMHSSNFMQPLRKKIAKQEKIVKVPNRNFDFLRNEESNFKMFYKQKLRVQHKDWSAKQVKAVLNSMWEKRKAEILAETPNMQTNNLRETKKQFSKVSGKTAYSEQKAKFGLSAQQIEANWKSLAVESKQYWIRKGKGEQPQVDADNERLSPANLKSDKEIIWKSKGRKSKQNVGFEQKKMKNKRTNRMRK